MPRRSLDDPMELTNLLESESQEKHEAHASPDAGNTTPKLSSLAPRVKKLARAVVSFRTIVVRLCKDLDIDPVDRGYIISRLKNEGVTFLTKTLPLYAKYTLMCCEAHKLLDAREIGFTNFELKGGVPVFLNRLLFGAVSGSAECLYRIRQLCDYFYKLAFEFTEKESNAAVDRYLDTENALSSGEIDWKAVELGRKITHKLFPSLVKADVGSILSSGPYFGPGAFYGSESLPSSIPFELHKKLPGSKIGYHHSVFRAYAGYFRPYPGASKLRWPARLTGQSKGKVAKICLVPKDSRGPRVISKEDLHLLEGQMAFNRWMSSMLEACSYGRILFSDQTVHQDLARKGSIDRSQATLDLKDASDRVRYSVCSSLFRDAPGIRWFLTNARSTHAELSKAVTRFTKSKKGKKTAFKVITKTVINLKKVANMGSGLCFPILAYTVFIAAVTGIHMCFPRLSLREVARMVYVYGDDLIVPSTYYEAVLKGLTAYGLLVNTNKSFVNGFFRESCGKDYYHGISVVPVRLRLSNGGLKTIGTYRNGFFGFTEKQVGLIVQLERHCRELVDAGLRHLSDYYYDRLSVVLGKLPLLSRECPALGRYDPNKIVPHVEDTFYVPQSVKVHSELVCPYRGIGKSFTSENGLGEDWSLTPLRHSLVLKRRVLEPAQRVLYGLPETPLLDSIHRGSFSLRS